MTTKKKILIVVAVVLPVLMVLFSGSRTNPKIEREVNWDSPRTKALFYRACADCHSHETKWPWYSYVAPVSWWVIGHVDHARGHFNISGKELGEADEAAHEVLEGEMPLPSYLPLHPEARLTPEEKKALITGLKNTFGSKEDKKKDKTEDHDKKSDDKQDESENSQHSKNNN